MSAWMYNIMWNKVKTINGKAIVRFHIGDYDVRTILVELEKDATQSAQGKLHLRSTLQAIISMRLNAE